MISTVVLSGFAVLTANAVTWNGVTAAPLDVVGSESSDDESSDDESSDDESSFDPMGWMPSNWRGDDYIQPSAESTPDLSYDDLPSDLDAFEVSEDLTQIISKAFNAFPFKLTVIMIPTVICLFIGWWLHK